MHKFARFLADPTNRGRVPCLFPIAGLAAVFLCLTGCRHERSVEDDLATPTMGAWSDSHKAAPAPKGAAAVGSRGAAVARFVDVSSASGLSYRWRIDGPRPLDILQTIGNGCAFLDFDGDGNLDVLLVGQPLALYRGDGGGRFSDVTRAAGLAGLRGHFLGCAVGDYDNDGFDDVYVGGYHTGLLLHNEGGKAFMDVTKQAGLGPQPWGTSCAWGDIDNDGRLDLYVCNYIDFDAAKGPRLCLFHNKMMSACPPEKYRPERGALYRNDGSGRFRDVTTAWGAASTSGNALGVAFADTDGSGRQSLAIANDTRPADLLHNQGGRFRNVGVASGIAYVHFDTYAGMGMDWGDYDNDGHSDLTFGTYQFAAKPIFHGAGPNLFDDEAERLGFLGSSYGFLTFGIKWFDYDNDGWLDLMLANGHVQDNIALAQPGVSFLQPTLLFHNTQARRLVDVSEGAGTAIRKPIMGRGIAVGDYDNDGRQDALVVDSQGAPLLLHNESPRSGHWLSVKLLGTKSNRDGYGARVTVSVGALTQTRVCHTDGSYLSASDARVHIGLGASTVASSVTVRWPSGKAETLRDVRADRQIIVTEGQPAGSQK